MSRSTRTPHAELRQTPPRSLEAQSPLLGPDDAALETEDLAEHFLFEATQSSPPPPHCERDGDEALFDGDADVEASLAAPFFDAEKPNVRGFERMWNEIIDRELAAELVADEDQRPSVIPS